VYIPGFNPTETQKCYRHIVGDHYFETLGIPLLLGRPLGQQDTQTSKLAMVINETMMREYFAGQNPVGQQIVWPRTRDTSRIYEIVGVARDVRYHHIRDEVPPTMYYSLRQNAFVPEEVSFFLRTTGDPRPLQNTVAALALQLDPSVPAVNFREETSVIERHLSLERTFAQLSSGFAGVGLLLACIGLYGTMAYTVAQRTREIGVRIALGAGRGEIVAMVLGDTLRVVVAGLVIGLPASWFFGLALKAELYGLSPHDSLSLTVAIALLLVVSFAAGLIPAMKAAQVDPMSALRCE
jgi:predicted permease